jgi:tetratricopeptide (TPR) repeat protein
LLACTALLGACVAGGWAPVNVAIAPDPEVNAVRGYASLDARGFAEAHALLDAAAAQYRQNGDVEGEVAALYGRGLASARAGRNREALDTYVQALRLMDGGRRYLGWSAYLALAVADLARQDGAAKDALSFCAAGGVNLIEMMAFDRLRQVQLYCLDLALSFERDKDADKLLKVLVEDAQRDAGPLELAQIMVRAGIRASIETPDQAKKTLQTAARLFSVANDPLAAEQVHRMLDRVGRRIDPFEVGVARVPEPEGFSDMLMRACYAEKGAVVCPSGA